jgi:hypothetical protein
VRPLSHIYPCLYLVALSMHWHVHWVSCAISCLSWPIKLGPEACPFIGTQNIPWRGRNKNSFTFPDDRRRRGHVLSCDTKGFQFKSLHFCAKRVPKVAIVRRAIVQGSTCAKNVFLSSRQRQQCTHANVISWSAERLFWVRGAVVIVNNNNNNRSCDGTRIGNGNK